MKYRDRDLTERDADVLWCLPRKEWVTPMDIGGTDSSHHSGTLRKLVRRGLVERKRRAGWLRPSYLYRRTKAGDAAYREYRAEHPIEEEPLES